MSGRKGSSDASKKAKAPLTPALEKANKHLNKYYDKLVKIDEKEMIENTEIAIDFVKKFVEFINTRYDTNVEYLPQGSSFEGLKVGKPDEFDFLLVFFKGGDVDENSSPKQTRTTEMAEITSSSTRLTNYDVILDNAFEESNLIWEGICSSWVASDPEDNRRCLSAKGAAQRFKHLLIIYRDDEDTNLPHGVACMNEPRITNHTLTTVITIDKSRGDTREVKINMSPAVRLSDEDGILHMEDGILHMAKAPNVPTVAEDKLDLLWLQCHSQEELHLMKEKTATDLKNYRIVKSFFSYIFNDGFVWKTLFFLSESEHHPIEFMKRAVFKLMTFLETEVAMRDRKHDECDGPCMMAYFGHEYVLSRYSDREVRKWRDQFNSFHRYLESGAEVHNVFNEALPEDQFKAIM